MLSKFLKKRQRAAAGSPEIPAGQRVYAIGDIHGRLDLLDDLLAQVLEDDRARGAADTTLVFLGDLVDRGPDSAGVVERLLLFRDQAAVRFLMGNHEEVFLSALGGDAKALKFFCRIGGRETILSYGVSQDSYNKLDFAELGAVLAARVPPAHRDFLAAFEDLIRIGDYVFVHAGIRPGIPLDEQRKSDLRWIREAFVDHRDPFEAVVVHGHTIREDVEFLGNRIGIDTGAFNTGKLSALGLEGQERWVLQT
ncbi:MAG: metallophosphoesterase family protein [Pseudomonadota bacterium]